MQRLHLKLILAIVLCGCSKVTTNASDGETTGGNLSSGVVPPKPFDGWNSLKFGMSFDDAFAAESGISWEGMSIRECRDEIPIKGCMLRPDEDRSYSPLFAGVAFLPRLQFNLDGVITQIVLDKELQSTTPAQCEGAHGRVLDQLAKKWGARSSNKSRNDLLIKKTPAGANYGRSKSTTEGIFVTDTERFNELADGREISLLSTFMPKSEYSASRCSISIYYVGPKSLARAPIEEPSGASGADAE